MTMTINDLKKIKIIINYLINHKYKYDRSNAMVEKFKKNQIIDEINKYYVPNINNSQLDLYFKYLKRKYAIKWYNHVHQPYVLLLNYVTLELINININEDLFKNYINAGENLYVTRDQFIPLFTTHYMMSKFIEDPTLRILFTLAMFSDKNSGIMFVGSNWHDFLNKINRDLTKLSNNVNVDRSYVAVNIHDLLWAIEKFKDDLKILGFCQGILTVNRGKLYKYLKYIKLKKK